MTRQEFLEELKSQVAAYVSENEKYQDKDFEYIFEDVIEDMLNDAIIEGVDRGMEMLEENREKEYDYCDEHEEQWKIEGRWNARIDS